MFDKESRVARKKLLVLGAGPEGYGGDFVREAVKQGNDVFVTSSNPDEARQEKVKEMGATLIPEALRFGVTEKAQTAEALKGVVKFLGEKGVTDLDGLVNFVAGGFRKDRNFLPYMRGMQQLQCGLNDFPKGVIENVTYVMAESHGDVAQHLGDANLLDKAKVISTSFREPMVGYIISDTKRLQEKIMAELANQGLDTMAAAIPRIFSPSSEIFSDVNWMSLFDYVHHMEESNVNDQDVKALLDNFEGDYDNETAQAILSAIEEFGLQHTVDYALDQLDGDANLVNPSILSKYPGYIRDLMDQLADQITSIEKEAGKEGVLLDMSKKLSAVTRLGTAKILMHEINHRQCESGETRRINHKTIIDFNPQNEQGESVMEKMDISNDVINISTLKETPHKMNRTEIEEMMGKPKEMYGDSMLFLDTAEFSDDGQFARGKFLVPNPAAKDSQERIKEIGNSEYSEWMRDHFYGHPLKPGVLQEEALNQLAVLGELRIDAKKLPLLTEIEKFKLETMVLPGDIIDLEVEVVESGKRERKIRIKLECNGKTSVGYAKAMMIQKSTFERNYKATKTVSDALKDSRQEEILMLQEGRKAAVKAFDSK